MAGKKRFSKINLSNLVGLMAIMDNGKPCALVATHKVIVLGKINLLIFFERIFSNFYDFYRKNLYLLCCVQYKERFVESSFAYATTPKFRRHKKLWPSEKSKCLTIFLKLDFLRELPCQTWVFGFNRNYRLGEFLLHKQLCANV